MNITELARQLKITPQELKAELPQLGFHIGAKAIQIPEEQAQQVIEKWKQKQNKAKEIKKIKEKINKAKEESSEEKEEKNSLIKIPASIGVYDLAAKMDLPVMKVMNELIKNGVLSSINENLDYEIAAIIAENLGFQVQKGEKGEKVNALSFKKKVEETLSNENAEELISRPPVVVIMGHVDHGKSSILDAIRESQIVAQEKGGITQHIGSYQIEYKNSLITFIDTPGHEAFESMRAHGGSFADLAVLVISADDKIQPQTLESIKVIQQEELPFIVALNKIDKTDADPERIKKELAEINLLPEEWGGEVTCLPISAKEKTGIDDLLETIILLADLNKDTLLSNSQGSLLGIVLESHLDLGLGPVATIILYNGSLKKGDNIIAGQSQGRFKFAKDQYGKTVERVEPGLPVQIFGLKAVPQVGDLLQDAESKITTNKYEGGSLKKFSTRGDAPSSDSAQAKYVKLIIRADVLGSLEAINNSLRDLVCSDVEVKIIKSGLGSPTEADIETAKTTGSWLISFNVSVSHSVQELIKNSGIKASSYNVIYKLIEDVEDFMKSLVKPELKEEKIGQLEVLEVFHQAGAETILGGRVTEGKVSSKSIARVWRLNANQKKEIQGELKITQVQSNKSDVSMVPAGKECGLKVTGKTKVEKGDLLEICQEVKCLPKNEIQRKSKK
ncbi:translation initiation factor IF-2 [Patescibacteria group bacterium]|nr:translation initiation factor IF-2 [Patescibacteria group bacterium]